MINVGGDPENHRNWYCVSDLILPTWRSALSEYFSGFGTFLLLLINVSRDITGQNRTQVPGTVMYTLANCKIAPP